MTDPADADRPRPHRLAAIDVGSNSIRLLVAEASPDGGYRVLDDEKVVAGLGRGMHRQRRIDTDTARDAARAVAHMKAIADGYGAERLRAVATWAVRTADNRDEFIDLVRRETGLGLEVIDGAEEARLAHLSVKHAFNIEATDVAVVDIGGGSTEILLSAAGLIEQISSISIGAVRLTEAVADPALRPDERLKQMRKIVRQALKLDLRPSEITPESIIGTGGTFTTLAAMHMHRRGNRAAARTDPVSVRGYELPRVEVRRLLEHLNAMPLAQRVKVPGLSQDRAEIIVAGLLIVEMVMKTLGADLLRTHDRGIRDALLLSMAHAFFPVSAERDAAPDRLRSARRLAERCHDETSHSEHVAELALAIYDQLGRLLPDPPPSLGDASARELLHAAALLHDIGYLISYARHHRHSHHLITHSEMPGFTQRELELIGNIARYHRRAHPKRKHRDFAQLEDEDRQRVRELAAILRIADGLDRVHAGNVRRVTVRLEDGAVRFMAAAEHEPAVDLWGASRKSGLFQEVFGLEPWFVWIPVEELTADDGTTRQTPMDPQ